MISVPVAARDVPRDVAGVRLDNAMLLFDEFVRAAAARPDAAALRGLERRFAERLDIQPSYWSQIKSRARQIGERLARQFEQRCKKPVGWMDLPHGAGLTGAPAESGTRSSDAPPAAGQQAQDDDERFIVGLVLTYYRRHPQRARTRLLDLLGEVLTPAALAPAPPKPAPPKPGSTRPTASSATPPKPALDDQSLWAQVRTGVAPLKPKK